MTKGFSPLHGTMEWKESIERSVGQKRGTDLEGETIRRIQELGGQGLGKQSWDFEQTTWVGDWQNDWPIL